VWVGTCQIGRPPAVDEGRPKDFIVSMAASSAGCMVKVTDHESLLPLETLTKCPSDCRYGSRFVTVLPKSCASSDLDAA
jgi:hypothetical protein